MGNGQISPPQTHKNDWIQYFHHGKSIIQNKITFQQFKLMTVYEDEDKIILSKLIERSIYTFPNTPKIIILNSQDQQIFILIQTSNSNFKYQIQKIKILIDLLQLMKNIFIIFHNLYKKYGPFNITQSMISINKNLQIIAWIHQKYQENQRQYPISSNNHPETIMIYNILHLIQKYTSFNLSYFQEIYNFIDIINIIKKIIYQKKIQNYTKQIRDINQQINLVKSFSPSKKIIVKSKSPKTNNLESSLSKKQKRNDIPKFIKTLKDKKIHLLESLTHRRTITRNCQEINKSNPKIESQINKFSPIPQITTHQHISLKTSPLKDTNQQKNHKNSRNPSNAQTCSQLTSSGESIHRTIKKRQFLDKNNYKKLFSYKIQSMQNISNKFESNQSQNYKMKTERQIYSAHHLNIPLNSWRGMDQSKKTKFHTNQEIIQQSEENSHTVSRAIQQQINSCYTSPQRSPRGPYQYFQVDNLGQQFSKIMNF